MRKLNAEKTRQEIRHLWENGVISDAEVVFHVKDLIDGIKKGKYD